jgi:hypothetical protein
MDSRLKRRLKWRAVIRFVVMIVTAVGLFATHLGAYYVGRVEGMQWRQREIVRSGEGWYESAPTAESYDKWSKPSQNLAEFISGLING